MKNKPIVAVHLNGMYMGGTENMTAIFLKYLTKDPTFNYCLFHKAQEDRTREPQFKEILGDKLFSYVSYPEFIEIMKELKPFILHRVSAGIPEWPFIPAVKQYCKHFVSTSVFGNLDNTVPISKTIFVSKHIQHLVDKFDSQYEIIRNPIEPKITDDNYRKQFNLENKFVFGHIGRPDPNTFDNLNLRAYKEIENENTAFLWMPESDLIKNAIKELDIKNIVMLPKSIDPIKIGKFYNTIDVLAHSRKDGEVNPEVMWNAFAHSKPVISHYGLPFNGHIECVSNAGFIVAPNDINEYIRIMKAFLDKTVDYNFLCDSAYNQWYNVGRSDIWVEKMLNLYKSLR